MAGAPKLGIASALNTDLRRMCRDELQGAMARFATPEYLHSIDQNGRYPYEIYEQWVALGLFRVGFPAAYGGTGGELDELLQVAQDLAYWSQDLYTAYGSALYAALRLLKVGSEAQKQEFLPALMAGSIRLSTSLSDPGTGSEMGVLTTSARRSQDGWILNGHAVWSSAAGARANVMQVLASTSRGADALTTFLVPNDAAGLQYRKVDTLVRRATGYYELFFDDVFVSNQCVLGEVDEGWSAWQACLPTERVLASAGYVGSAQKVVDLAVAHAKEREQSGQGACEFAGNGRILADMQTLVDASRLLVERAAAFLQMGRDAACEVAMAKLFSSETYAKVAHWGMQVLGPEGFRMENEMQRHFRDARSATVSGGSSQQQRHTIATGMGLGMH